MNQGFFSLSLWGVHRSNEINMGAFAVTSRKKPDETLRKTLQVHQVLIVIKEPFPLVMEKLFMNLK